MQAYLDALRSQGKSIGFTPTMGALHNGHISLIDRTIESCDISVVSIFVNPTQFNEQSDLDKYPRTTAADISLILPTGNHILFLPTVEEVYPQDSLADNINNQLDIDLGYIGSCLEGTERPGHFEGVMQVVKRLLDIVQPNKIFMGQKDFQQWTIIRFMCKALKMPVEVVPCPIIREEDGLAMSSRNVRLSDKARQDAVLISQKLFDVKAQKGKKGIEKLIDSATTALNKIGEVEYFSVINMDSMEAINTWDAADNILAVAAVWVGGIRLIDNVIIQQK